MVREIFGTSVWTGVGLIFLTAVGIVSFLTYGTFSLKALGARMVRVEQSVRSFFTNFSAI